MQGNWSSKWQFTYLDYGKVWLRQKKKENPTLLILSSVFCFLFFSFVFVFVSLWDISGEKRKQFSISMKEPVGRLWQGPMYRVLLFKVSKYYYNFLCVNFFHATHKKGQIYYNCKILNNMVSIFIKVTSRTL